jgi:1-deoxy-D-xylulose-5-phosphate synthase
LPFRVEKIFDAPAGYHVVIADSHVKAAKSEVARHEFNARIAAYNLGLALLKQRCPEIAAAVEHLRDLSPAQQRQLAAELREEIIATIARTGGHLGASLGVVELTIALHAELRSPKDKIVWDVGHQAYAHKLLTGRLPDFTTIRTHGGISGFPRRSESEHDAFGTGHASTSVSAAMGLAEAGRLSVTPDPGHVVAVIGDGALTGGMAYEGLNQAGHLQTPMVVVLNDNAMSIKKNVGALSSYLSRLRTEPALYRLRRDFERRVQHFPGIGGRMYAMGEQLKDGVKAAIVPGMLFEDLGFTYIGVVDGHDIGALREHLRADQWVLDLVGVTELKKLGHAVEGLCWGAAVPGFRR